MTDRRYHMEAQELAAAEAAGSDHVPVTPRPAAAVIMVRDRPEGGEVLLVRRRSDVGFAAGAFVFPGGTLDPEDTDPAWNELMVAPSAEDIAGAAEDDGPPALAFAVAALREMFEETGVLLVSGAEPGPEALAKARRSLVAGERPFPDLVRDLGVRLAGDRLLLCARWITPESISRRYDARFFLAEAPTAAKITPEPGELVEHAWVSPEGALERYFAYEFPMLFPTAVTLGWMEGATSVEGWVREFRSCEVKPILPRLRRIDGKVIPLMPGEPGYDEIEGDG